MPPPEPVLICALSGRALAQAARAAGFAPIVLDAFGDLDTRDAAERWLRVPVDRRWHFQRGAAAGRRGAAGAGADPAGLGLRLRARHRAAGRACRRPAELWGNRPAVVRAVKDPFAFAGSAATAGHRPSRDPRSRRPRTRRLAVQARRRRRRRPRPAGRAATAARPRLVLAAAGARATGLGAPARQAAVLALQRAMGDAAAGAAVPLRRRRGAGQPDLRRARPAWARPQRSLADALRARGPGQRRCAGGGRQRDRAGGQPAPWRRARCLSRRARLRPAACACRCLPRASRACTLSMHSVPPAR